MKLFIAADHRGVEVCDKLYSYLKEKDYDIDKIDLINNELDDYTDFAFKLCEEVIKNPSSLGILICGNGIGMSIAANKVKGIRCARVVNTDDAYKAKNHNGANVIAIGANLDIDELKEICEVFINTESASLERYLNRINKIINYENGEYNEL